MSHRRGEATGFPTFFLRCAGRDPRATRAVFDGPEGTGIVESWAGMVKEGIAANVGRGTDVMKRAFGAGDAAMILDSTAVLKGLLDGIAGRFELGTGFLPRPFAGGKGGVIVGGASLWILKCRPAAEQKAAWEFVKFMASPAQQAAWHLSTGYFPIRSDAYRLPEVTKAHKALPQFQTAIDQLHGTVLKRSTQGALVGVMTEARQIIEREIEAAILGQKTAKQAVDSASAQVTAAIQRYNRSVGQ